MAKKDDKNKDIIDEIKPILTKEVNKEIKQNLTNEIDEYKKQLDEYLKDKINDEVSLAVKKEQKKLIRRKNFSILKKYIIILILLLIIGYLLYILYDNNYFNTLTNTTQTATQTVQNNQEDLTDYEYLLDYSTIDINLELLSAYYLYSQTHDISNVDMSYLLNMAYQKIDENDIKTNGKTIEVDEQIIQDAFESLFDVEYEPCNFIYQNLEFIYDEESKIYSAANVENSDTDIQILEQVVKIYKDDDYLYIQTYATIYNSLKKCFYKFDNPYSTFLCDINTTDLSAYDDLNSYRYIYKDFEGVYKLITIEKLN